MGYLAEAGANRAMMTNDPQAWDQLLRRSVVYGTVMASFTIQDFSIGRLKTLSREDLMHRREKFMRMMSVG